MADFPTSPFEPRTLTNVARHPFDADKTDTVFAEDINNLGAEVNAIEKALLPEPENAIPFGFEIGDETCRQKVTKFAVGDVFLPLYEVVVTGIGALIGMIAHKGLAIMADSPDYPTLTFTTSDLEHSSSIYHNTDIDTFNLTKSLELWNGEDFNFFSIYSVDTELSTSLNAKFVSNANTQRIELDTNFYSNGTITAENNLESLEMVNAVGGFKNGSNIGQNYFKELVTDVRIVDGVPQFKKQGFLIRGGLITRVDEEWDWTIIPSE